MITEEKKQISYPYDYTKNIHNNFVTVSQTIGKLPKIKLVLPKISIVENIDLKFD